MRVEETRRNRSVLLARWRGAAGVVRDDDAGADASADLLAVSPSPVPAPDQASLMAELDAELARSVSAGTADAVRRMLASASREDLLTTLDTIEDVLDAVLLTQGRVPA